MSKLRPIYYAFIVQIGASDTILAPICNKRLKAIFPKAAPYLFLFATESSKANRGESDKTPITALFFPQGGNGAVMGISELELGAGLEPATC